MRPKLWTRDFTLLISATVLGAAGGIAGSFALSFLVYEETGSTLAAALLIAITARRAFSCRSRPRPSWTACRANPSSSAGTR